MLNPPVNGKIQGLFKAFECFQVTFKANLIFKDFEDSPVYLSTFKACANPVDPCPHKWYSRTKVHSNTHVQEM